MSVSEHFLLVFDSKYEAIKIGRSRILMVNLMMKFFIVMSILCESDVTQLLVDKQITKSSYNGIP